MEFSEADHGCNKHSDHQEKQGVCPFCLRERLSRLTSLSYNEASNSRIDSSIYFCPADYSFASPSSSSSNSASPARRHNSRKRTGYGVMRIMGMSSSFRLKVGTSNDLKKSRSIAFVPRNLDADEEEAEYGKQNKGFWSKLVHFKGKKDVLTHSTSRRIVIGRLN